MRGCTPGKRFVQLLATLFCDELTDDLGDTAQRGLAAAQQRLHKHPTKDQQLEYAGAFRSVIELSGCESSENKDIPIGNLELLLLNNYSLLRKQRCTVHRPSVHRERRLGNQ